MGYKVIVFVLKNGLKYEIIRIWQKKRNDEEMRGEK